MANEDGGFEDLIRQLRVRQGNGEVAELFVSKEPGPKRIQVRAVGSADWLWNMVDATRAHPDYQLEPSTTTQAYYFMSQELRPGSGVIRVFGGRAEGPGGTLTCFLSSQDGNGRYFAAAGHVLSNFWVDEDVRAATQEVRTTASIYRYQKGFPATRSTRFLGRLRYISCKPRAVEPGYDEPSRDEDEVTLDMGIVKFTGKAAPVQRTTCYGTFGESSADPYGSVHAGQKVMKCGAEEPHLTYAVVQNPRTDVTVYGPGGKLYELRNQVILEMAHGKSPLDNTDPPTWRSAPTSQAPFAVPGDSGAMVVDKESKRPVGMLIAGSVLDGLYVMTPIRALWKFWKDRDLVFMRG